MWFFIFFVILYVYVCDVDLSDLFASRLLVENPSELLELDYITDPF